MNINAHQSFVLIGATLFGTIFSIAFGVLIFKTLNALPVSLLVGIIMLSYCGSIVIAEIMWISYFKKLNDLSKKK